MEALINSGLLILFLDAFDEHLKFANRSDASRFLTHLTDAFVQKAVECIPTRIVLTSRDYYLTSDKIFDDCLKHQHKAYRLLPFNRGERALFIQRQLHNRVKSKQVDDWCDALEAAAGNLSSSQPDYLVGHSLFLHAFCQFIEETHEDQDSNNASVRDPDSFKRMESANLFDRVIDLINQREADQKSRWDESLIQGSITRVACFPF